MKQITDRLADFLGGPETLSPAADLGEYVAHSSSLRTNQDRMEVRLLATFMTAVFMLLLIEPIFYLLLVPEALIVRVGRLTWSPWMLIGAYGLASVLTAPHMFDLLFRPGRLSDKGPRRCAAFAALLAALAWIMLANLALPLDLGAIEWPYAVRATVCVCVGLIYAYSVNAQQMRECHAAAGQ